ncbi:uncharacterized protein DUF4234 [Melghirimyces profundicolus]|uniref:Uncharacterized protein DUF4234 n=1 Tax=Melghirimyces profundicolus TaxID=1242148 RepID=A0A2T6AU79_9BACL|nr:DUF4234 domain-containing protein [Melghirimyces profundicolus]PTX47374.1 uncharacterized protein DUF4234 [Melghirimyces profundicolus]
MSQPEIHPMQTGPAVKKASVFFTLVMSVITLGIYVPYWFISRREALNRLDSEVTLPSAPAKIVFILYILSAIFLPVAMIGGEGMMRLYDTLDIPITYGGMAVCLYLAMRTRLILNEHLGVKSVGPVKTFFLWIWYLQYKINAHL